MPLSDAGFKGDTVSEPLSLSFLGIDELLDHEAACDAHRQLAALAKGDLAAYELPA